MDNGWLEGGSMIRFWCVPALIAIGLAAVDLAHAQASQNDDRRALIQTLRLAKAQRVALKRTAAEAREALVAACLDRLATDERLEADLMPVVARSVATPEGARPILAFLATPAGRKLAAAVERREPEFKPALLRPVILPGGVPMSAEELTTDERRAIDDFLRSDPGAALVAILKDTTGFAQLIRILALRKTLAAECGIGVK
jgi:hypothetical protein